MQLATRFALLLGLVSCCACGSKANSEPSLAGDIVARERFEDGAVSSDWEVDGSLVQEGQMASHPPLLAAGERASLVFACAGHEHTEVAFWYSVVGELSLYVDGKLNRRLGTTYDFNGSPGGWTEAVMVVPTGAHEYRFEVSSEVELAPQVWIDDIRCSNHPLVSSDPETVQVQFEDGYVPTEISSTWDIDNSRAYAGQMASHPPLLVAGDTASFEFACADHEHSEMAFWYSVVGELSLHVDGKLNRELGTTYDFNGSPGGWTEAIMVVPTGTHEYRFEVFSDVEVAPQVWLDDLRCNNHVPMARDPAVLTFEEGYFPAGVSGTWEIDNSSAQEGKMASHPPLLSANEPARLEFRCDAHSKLTFWYSVIGELSLYMDNQLNQTLGTTYDFNGGPGGWVELPVDVPPDAHDYRFEVTSDVDGTPRVWVDNIRCTSD